MDYEQTAFLAGGKWHVQYPLHGGSFNLAFAGRQFLSGATVSVATDRWLIHADDCGPGEAREEAIIDVLGNGRRLVVSHQSGTIALTVSMALYDTFPGLSIRMSVTNRGTKPLAVFGFNLIEALGEKASFWPAYGGLNEGFFKNGYHSWAPSTVRRRGDYDRPPRGKAGRVLFSDPGSRPFDMKDHFTSDWMCALRSRTGHEHCAMAFVTCENQAGRFLYRRPERAEDFLARSQTDGINLSEGQSLESEMLYITIGEDASALLAECANAMGRSMKARVSGSPLWVGRIGSPAAQLEHEAIREWDRATEQSMRSIQSIPFDAVFLEGRWYPAVGDWTPSGTLNLRDWAHKMKDAGIRPGLWLAPFAADQRSQLASDHPEWLIRTGRQAISAGAPAGRPLYGIDMSSAGAEQWLRGLIRQITSEWGFDCLMLDWLYTATLPGEFADGNQSRIANLRRGLQLIREEAPEALLMGGACPLSPAVGILDSVRIGPDSYVSAGPTLTDRIRGTAPAPRAMENVLNLANLDRRLWRSAVVFPPAASAGNSSCMAITGMGASIIIVDQPGTVSGAENAWRMQTPGSPGLTAGLLDSGIKAIMRPDNDTGGARIALCRLDTLPDPAISLDRLGMNGTFHVMNVGTLGYLEYCGQTNGLLKVQRDGYQSFCVRMLRPVLDRPHFVACDLPGRARVSEEYENGVLRLRGSLAGQWQTRLIICIPDGRRPAIGTPYPGDGRLYSIPVEFNGTFGVEVTLK